MSVLSELNRMSYPARRLITPATVNAWVNKKGRDNLPVLSAEMQYYLLLGEEQSKDNPYHSASNQIPLDLHTIKSSLLPPKEKPSLAISKKN